MDARRIMVVEDEPDVARDIRVKLEHLGYTVPRVVADAEAAISGAAELAPDLVLMDIVLPGKQDGIDAAESIRQQLGIPVVYLTAYADQELLARARLTEPYAYILKPVTERELSTVLPIAFYRAEVDHRLRQSAWLADSLMDLCDPVLTVDRERKIVVINRAAQTLLGGSRQQLVGTGLESRVRLEDDRGGDKLGPLLSAALERGEGQRVDRPLRLYANGNITPVMAGISPLHASGSEAGGAVILLRDVTEMLDQEGRREALLARLAEANAEMESFVYTISHDLKSPLVTIGGFAGMLEKDVATGNVDAVTEDLYQIRLAANHMQDLISGLLNLSRAGRALGDTKVVNLADILSDIREGLAAELGAADAELRLVTDSVRLRVDPQRFREALECLIDNALRYRRDGVAPRITIGWRSATDGVDLYVSDNGRGIAPADHERIFELFERCDSTTDGTGVGLSIARRVVEAHGGRIRVESKPGSGSTFWMHLPSSAWVGNVA